MKHILRLVNYCKNTITSTQPTFLPRRFGLCQRPSSEEVCSVSLPVLASVASGTFKYVVTRLICQHKDTARVVIFQPRDNIFECSMNNCASSVLLYDQLRAFETSKVTHRSHHCGLLYAVIGVLQQNFETCCTVQARSHAQECNVRLWPTSCDRDSTNQRKQLVVGHMTKMYVGV